MPITAANKHRYPDNWPEVRAAILKRAKGRCERCGKPNGARVEVVWDGTGRWCDWDADDGQHAGVWRDRNGQPLPQDVAAVLWSKCRETRVVLTVAHWPDHRPENCDPGNLWALCQGCHLWIDRDIHAANARETFRKRRERFQPALALETC